MNAIDIKCVRLHAQNKTVEARKVRHDDMRATIRNIRIVEPAPASIAPTHKECLQLGFMFPAAVFVGFLILEWLS